MRGAVRLGRDAGHAMEGTGFAGAGRPAQDSWQILDSPAGFLESWRGILTNEAANQGGLTVPLRTRSE
jgi:hypothetical protein